MRKIKFGGNSFAEKKVTKTAKWQILLTVFVLGLIFPVAGQGSSGEKERVSSFSIVVNINTANAQELEKIPGIGPKTSARIIAYRNKRLFRTTREITRIKGVKERTFRKIKDFITVSGPSVQKINSNSTKK